jgi:hypothetical protein
MAQRFQALLALLLVLVAGASVGTATAAVHRSAHHHRRAAQARHSVKRHRRAKHAVKHARKHRKAKPARKHRRAKGKVKPRPATKVNTAVPARAQTPASAPTPTPTPTSTPQPTSFGASSAPSSFASGATPSAGTTSSSTTTPSTPLSLSGLIGPLGVLTPFPTGAQVFAPTSVWNAPLSATPPVAGNSTQLVSALAGEVQREIGLRTGPWINTNSWSVPVYTVGTQVPTVHVTLDSDSPTLQQALNAVPIPANAQAAAGGDEHLVIYQPGTDTMWELWLAQHESTGWHAAWGGVMTNVSTNPGYFPAPFGASGTSLPLMAGLITIHELASGQINHALAIAIPNTAAGTATWPAQRGDGRTTGSTAIPEGTRFRIDPSVDLSTLGLSPAGLAIARAVQKYGMIVRDTGANVAFYAEDPTTTTGNPYGQIFAGQYPNAVLQGFPWSHLQVIAPSAG